MLICFCLMNLWTSIHLEIWFLIVDPEWDLPFMFSVTNRMLALEHFMVVCGWSECCCGESLFWLFVLLASVPDVAGVTPPTIAPWPSSGGSLVVCWTSLPASGRLKP